MTAPVVAGATAPHRYRVVGNPIAHSRSPEIHAAFARQTGERIVYDRELIPIDPPAAFDDAVRAFAAAGGRGLNVTLPFKERAFSLADRCSDRAQVAGAVNTLCLLPDGIAGDNTDGPGLVADLTGRLGFSLAGRSVTILGAGGAARGIVYSLLSAGAAALTVANRTVARADALATELNRHPAMAGRLPRIAAAALLEAPPADLVINATSAGVLEGHLALAPALFRHCALAYDCLYSARPTTFMTEALAGRAAIVSDGLGMLVEQAAESFLLWRGVRPLTAPVYRLLRDAVSAVAPR